MKKIMKLLALGMALTLAVGVFAGCGGSSNGGSANKETQAPAAEGGTIVFGTNAEFPPFEFTGTNGVLGQYDGIDMAIANKIAQDNGMTAEINNMEFDSLLVALENGQVDAVIAGMTITDERKEAVDFTVPYFTATQVMIVKE